MLKEWTTSNSEFRRDCYARKPGEESHGRGQAGTGHLRYLCRSAGGGDHRTGRVRRGLHRYGAHHLRPEFNYRDGPGRRSDRDDSTSVTLPMLTVAVIPSLSTVIRSTHFLRSSSFSWSDLGSNAKTTCNWSCWRIHSRASMAS